MDMGVSEKRWAWSQANWRRGPACSSPVSSSLSAASSTGISPYDGSSAQRRLWVALTDTIEERASLLAERKLASVEPTMRLEAQAMTDKKQGKDARQQLIEQLLRRPARLWDEP
jgi:hypothetical protein